MALNCCVAPLGIEGFAGVTAIDTSVAGVTASVTVLLVTLPAVLLTTTSNVDPLSAVFATAIV
jgi:hypothetical protein